MGVKTIKPMFYHILVETKNSTNKNPEKYFAFDIQLEETVLDDYIVPYIKSEEFLVDGFIACKSNLKRIKITQTQESVKALVDEAANRLWQENRNSNNSVIIHFFTNEEMAFSDSQKDLSMSFIKKANKLLQQNPVQQFHTSVSKAVQPTQVSRDNFSVIGNGNTINYNSNNTQAGFSLAEKNQLIELFQEIKDLHQSNPTVSTLAEAALAEVNGKADKNSLRKIWDTIVSIGGQISTSVATAGVLHLLGF